MNYARLRNDLIALALLAITVFLGLSLASFNPADRVSGLVYPASDFVTNLCGEAGAKVAFRLISWLGYGAWILLLGLVLIDLRLFSNEEYDDPILRVMGWVFVLLSFCVSMQLAAPFHGPGDIGSSGGYVGSVATSLLKEHFQFVGIVILLIASTVAGLILAGEFRMLSTAVALVQSPVRFATRGVQPGTWSVLRKLAYTASPATAPTQPSIEVAPVAETPVSTPAPTPAKPSRSRTAKPGPVILSLADRLGTADDDTPSLPAIGVFQPEAETATDDIDSPHVMSFTVPESPRVIKVNPPVALQPKPVAAAAVAARPEYELPEHDILEDGEAFPYEQLAERAQVAAATLERTFQHFGLNVKVVEIDTGPVITQFELELEAGLRLSKVTALADDLAIALRVPSVRVVAPIPGKNTVGVEVPNDLRVMVRLKELIESAVPEQMAKGIPLFLGKDVSGKPLVVDMCKMPHLLIAGRTGTGKSVCLNTLILSILMTRSPEQVRMLMIDPKMVELSPYNRIPHLMHPVITDMKKAEAVLGWSVEKMEERYDLLARVGVRHLDSYNKLGKETILKRLGIDPDSEEADAVPETMPYIVIIADEMADMMMTSGKDVEGHIIRLAQKSRAVGIHLVLATQKPTVDVITGLIKSNLPARISFQVASKMDSRVVLDENGADKLLGNGDMLYLAPGTSVLNRAQGTYVSDDEVTRVIEFFEDCDPQYDPELQKLKVATRDGKPGEGGGASSADRDELYDRAVEVIIREGRGSVSLLQRALGVGYGRGARLIDTMAEDGIVGTYNGSQAREVIMTMEDWEDLRAARM